MAANVPDVPDVDNVDGLLSCFKRKVTSEDTVNSEPYQPPSPSGSVLVKAATEIKQGVGIYRISPGLIRGNALIGLYVYFTLKKDLLDF